MKSFLKLFALFFFLFAGFVRLVAAQGVGSSGQIQGTITDTTGGVVGSVSVTATDILKGITYTASTNGSGVYQIAGLPPSTYNVTAQQKGFQTETQTGLVLTVGQLAVIDIKIGGGDDTNVVEVTAEPPVVKTERGSQADTVTQRYIEDPADFAARLFDVHVA